jgi:hypothetical protein
VEAGAEMAFRSDKPSLARRGAIALIVIGLAIGSGILWIGIPIICLWVSSKVTESFAEDFLLALPMTIAAMMLWTLVLVWLNQLYLRVTGIEARMEADAQAGWRRRRLRGPLESMLFASFLIAMVALFFWFFVLAENPSRQVL